MVLWQEWAMVILIFFQSPSWNSVAWDTSLIHKFRQCKTKSVDVHPWCSTYNALVIHFLMPNYIEMYNLLWCRRCSIRTNAWSTPLRKANGQKDYPGTLGFGLITLTCTNQAPKEASSFAAIQPFPHSQLAQGDTSTCLCGKRRRQGLFQNSSWRPCNKQELLLDLSKGGFGLVWGNWWKSEDELGLPSWIFPINFHSFRLQACQLWCLTIFQMLTMSENMGLWLVVVLWVWKKQTLCTECGQKSSMLRWLLTLTSLAMVISSRSFLSMLSWHCFHWKGLSKGNPFWDKSELLSWIFINYSNRFQFLN